MFLLVPSCHFLSSFKSMTYATVASSGGTGHCFGTSDRCSTLSTLTFFVTMYLPSLSFADSSISNLNLGGMVVLDDSPLIWGLGSSPPEMGLTSSILISSFLDLDKIGFVLVGISGLIGGASSSESRSSITSTFMSRLLLGGLLVGADKVRFFERACFISSASGSESLEISMMSGPVLGTLNLRCGLRRKCLLVLRI